jgi:hypothetical protein
VLGLALASLFLIACGGKRELPSDPLAYVPADTPYVLVNPKGTPRAVIDAWMGFYDSSHSDLYAELAKDPALQQIAGELGAWIRALMPEVANWITGEGLARLGFKAEARYVLYGHGFLPVYRYELDDATKLHELVQRVEARLGKTIATRKIDEHTLWSIGDERLSVLFGAIGPYFVATLLPASADESRVRAQLGLTLPKRALADTDTLAHLNRSHGFDGRLSGYIDVPGLAQRLTGREAADRAVIEAFGVELPKLSAACNADLDRITAQFPRIAMGTRAFDAKTMDFSKVVELEPETARAWQSLAAPIPGAAMTTASMLDVALSANLPRAVSLLGTIADAVIARPFQCEHLADLNDSMIQLKAALAHPVLVMAGSVTALRLGLLDLALEQDTMTPSRVAAFAAVASPMPMMLWGLAQQSFPPLAKVTLTPDHRVVTLPQGIVPTPLPLSLQLVATSGSLGVGVGEVGAAELQSAATLPAVADGTVLAYGASGRLFTLLGELFPDSAQLTAEAAAQAEFEGADDESESVASDSESSNAQVGRAAAQALSTKQIENSRAMFLAFGERLERMEVAFRVTERGIEIRQTSRLKDT